MAAVESAATMRPSSTIAWKSCCTIFHYGWGPCSRQATRNIVLDECADFVTINAVPASPPASTILTVTLNFALDLTYGVDRVTWHGVNRVASVAERAGGKGVNVARVLQALGHRALVAGLAGGRTGEAAREELGAAGLEDVLVPIGG